MNKNIKRKVALLTLGIGLVITGAIGISFSFWKYESTQENANVIGTDCLSVQLLDESEGITIEKAYPITDEEGKKLKPYTFTVKNTCDTLIDYSIQLESLGSDHLLDSQYIAVMIDEQMVNVLDHFKEAKPTYSDQNYTAVEAHILLTSFLDKQESRSHSLRLWLDENADLNAMNKTFLSKIVIAATPNEVLASVPSVRISNLNANKEEIADLGQTNNYVFTSQADVACEGEKSTCFVKFSEDVHVTGTILQVCDEKLEVCTDLEEDASLLSNTWYKTKSMIGVRPASENKSVLLETMTCVGIDCSAKETFTLVAQDQTAPIITVNDIETNTHGAVLDLTLEDSGSGIVSKVCRYGLNEEELNMEGQLIDDVCTISGFDSNTTYYYAVEAVDRVGNLAKKTGTITTNEVITAPTITGGGINYAESQTITVSVSGIADSGVKVYEYYISKSSDVPSSDVEITGTTNDSITITDEGTSYVFYRTVSNKDNKSSWSGYQEVNVFYKASSITYTNRNDATIQSVQDVIDAIRKW